MKKIFLLFLVSLLVIPSISFQGKAQGKIIWTKVVQLTAEEAGTDVMANGMAIFRLSSDMVLSYRLIVQQPDEGDMQTAAHIHYGAAGVNGGVAIPLAMSGADFNKNLSIQLTSAQFDDLVNDALYVNFHSVWYPAGNIRGQIR